MKKNLYNITIFTFHVITLILLFALCIHFEIINMENLNFPKEAIIAFFQNDYVVNIVCTILTAVVLYVAQVYYSKCKIKKDFRCNEVISDVYSGIESTCELIEKSKELCNKVEKIEKDSTKEFDVRRKEEALQYLEFYKNHKTEFYMCNLALTYPNNWLLIDSIQTAFFINLNFKLLSIINNIKNRWPNLDKEYPEIEELFAAYTENEDDKTLVRLGDEIHHFLIDIDFMSKYWLSLLDYLKYNPILVKLQKDFLTEKYPDLMAFFTLPVAQQNKAYREIQRKASLHYLKYRIHSFFE